MNNQKGKVIVAMSGGVDSAVAALLLQRQGYDVIGVHLRVWQYPPGCKPGAGSCCSPDDVEDARRTAEILSIPFYTLGMEDQFEEAVIRPFIEDYTHRRTPNPCVRCNTFIKFGTLLEKAASLGIDLIATGHYARIERLSNGRLAVSAGVDAKKNQSYYLYGLQQGALARTLFPLGNLTKDEVRALAKSNQLHVAEKHESQEICFVPGNDYRVFLHDRGVSFTPGYFRLSSGEILGKHEGVEKYTIGQRKGLGVAYKEPLYVLETREDGDVIVGPKVDVICREFYVRDLVLQGIAEEELSNLQAYECRVQVRYRSLAVEAVVDFEAGAERFRVRPRAPLASVTPGQSAVFYTLDKDVVLAGGIIER